MAMAIQILAPPQVNKIPNTIIKIAPNVKIVPFFSEVNYFLIISGFSHLINERIKLKITADTHTPQPRPASASNE